MADKIPDELIVVCNVLDRMNVKHWVDTGTLLGLVRDGAPMGHDLDISLLSDEIGSIYGNQRMWGSMGYTLEVMRQKKAPGIVIGFRLNPESGMFIDFRFWYENKNHLYCYQMANGGFVVPKDLVLPLSEGEFLVREPDFRGTLAVPGKTEEYLAYRYGDWKTPRDGEKGFWAQEDDLSYDPDA